MIIILTNRILHHIWASVGYRWLHSRLQRLRLQSLWNASLRRSTRYLLFLFLLEKMNITFVIMKGWFSLADDLFNVYNCCLTNPLFQPEIDYLRLAAQYKVLCYEYLALGRLMRPVDLQGTFPIIHSPLRFGSSCSAESNIDEPICSSPQNVSNCHGVSVAILQWKLSGKGLSTHNIQTSCSPDITRFAFLFRLWSLQTHTTTRGTTSPSRSTWSVMASTLPVPSLCGSSCLLVTLQLSFQTMKRTLTLNAPSGSRTLISNDTNGPLVDVSFPLDMRDVVVIILDFLLG